MKIGKVIATDKLMATVECFSAEKCICCNKRERNGECERCPVYDDAAATNIVAYNSIGASVGELVECKKSTSESLLFFFFVFALPIVAALICYFASALFTDDSAMRTRISLLALVIATSVSCAYSFKKMQNRCDYSIKRILHN